MVTASEPSSRSDLFGAVPPAAAAARRRQGPTTKRPPAPAPVLPHWRELASSLPSPIRLGTSSWHFPGWRGLVFDGEHSAAELARSGLQAYAQHPLLRTVSLDRSFYRSPRAAEYAALATQVPADFRFVVKAAAAVCDAVLRAPGSGAPERPNPGFLDPVSARDVVLQPALDGLGDKLGVLVFQLSPLPSSWLAEPRRLHAALERLFSALPRPAGALLALELRDGALLTPALAALLKAQRVQYCVGVHARMPPLHAQLPMLRALWPGPLVCRWNLQQGLRYEQARQRFEPFDVLAAPDPRTRGALARVARATAEAGQPVFITINNKAEGSAPRSVIALAEQLRCPDDGPGPDGGA